MKHEAGTRGRPNGAAARTILARRANGQHEVVFPDVRNVAVMARLVLVYAGLLLAAAVVRGAQPADWVPQFVQLLAATLPVAAPVLLVWLLGNDFLRERLAYWQAALAMALLTVAMAWLTADWMGLFSRWQVVVLSLLALGAMLAYLQTLGRALSPALAEARLQALQARIRPHFLFNSINGVLGVLRSDPRRAETALEDLADLFRVLMKDNRELCPLHDEVVLTRQYLDLEKLRLGARLEVGWKLDKMPTDAQVPPLVLQPLVENAVYYGVEPSPGPARVEVEIYRVRSEVHVFVRNPWLEAAAEHQGGNKMAMENIRERLALHFDAEAQLTAGRRDRWFVVHLVLPYRKPGNVRKPV